MNVKRRDFVKGFAAAAGVAAFSGCAGGFACRRRAKLAAQLYSIHKIFWERPEECLGALRAAGYDKPSTSLEEGVRIYVQEFLSREDAYL